MVTRLRDLIPEVLRRLGVKDLLRFRCVSKPWCALIDGPYFNKLHLSHSIKISTHLSLLLHDGARDIFSVEFDLLEVAQKLNHPFSDEGVETEMMGSCNGLVALFKGKKELELWNPSTRQSRMLLVARINEINFPGM